MEMRRKHAIFASVFLVSFTALLTEILLTRIFSVTSWYHSSFFVVSTAMFGFSFGGVYLFVKKDKIKLSFEQILFYTLLLFSLSFLPLILLVPKISLPIWIGFQEQTIFFNPGINVNFDLNITILTYLLKLVLLFFICQLPFFFIGFLMSYLFTHFKNESGKLYFFDLIGASSGAVFSVVIINHLGAINSLFLLGIVSSIAFLLICGNKIKAPVLILVIFTSLLLLNSHFDTISITNAKGKRMDNIFTKWNSFSMVRVFRESGSHPVWVTSPVYQGSYPPSLRIDIDAWAATSIINFDGDFKKVEFLRYDLNSFAYHMSNFSDVLIIGPGGGRDVLAALLFGSERIVGVEINPIIVNDIMKDKFREYSGNLYLLDGVEVIVDDARSYIRNSEDRYGVILVSMVDSGAATSAGAYSLSENNLYTVESIAEYIDHLSEDGYLTISRRYYAPISNKMLILYLKAAEKLGIEDPDRHMVLIRSGSVVNHIFKKSEFTDAELLKLSNLAHEMEFEVVYMPASGVINEHNEIITGDLDEFIRTNPYDLRPSIDDRPFFFNTKRMRSLPSILLGVTQDIGIFMLYGLFLIALVLTLALIIFPVYLKRGDFLKTKTNVLYLMYFSLLGLSFMMVEMSFIQRFMLFLGHPIYAITIVISSLLLFAGIGSFLTNRIGEKKLKSNLRIILLVVIGIIICYNLTLYQLFNMLLGSEIRIRILTSILLLGIMGIFMGMAFPIGIRMVGLKNESLIPFCYSLNGAFSVLGSILAVIFSMNIGFTKTIFIAVALYFTAYVISSSKNF